MPTQDKTKTILSDLATQAQNLGVPGVSQYITPPSMENTVTATDLEPVTPINVPPIAEPTGASSLEGSLSAFAKSFEKQAAEAKKEKEKSGKDLFTSLINSTGETGLTDKFYSQPGGVDETQAELSEINNQILQEQEGLRREIETIQDNAEGLTRGAVAGRIDEARRKSLRTQADLSVIQLAKQGRYDSAKAIADRAISVQLEKDKQRNDILKFIYEENKDAFDKSEQRAFTVAQSERERQLENKEYRLRAEYDAKIKQSDPLYQAQLLQARAELEKTRAETLKISGATVPATPLALSKQQTSINEVEDLTKNPALTAVVGPTSIARGKIPIPFTSGVSYSSKYYSGEAQNFIGTVEQLRSGLNLDALINAKSQGATFGALSDQELRILANTATKIGSWAVKDSDGNVIGYNVDEKSFKTELDKINNYAKLDYILKGGDAASVGVNITSDGKMWAQNSDGTVTELQ